MSPRRFPVVPQGIWEAPDIPNPEFVEDKTLYNYKDTKYVGFELWQVKAGTIFDNIFLGDSYEVRRAAATRRDQGARRRRNYV